MYRENNRETREATDEMLGQMPDLKKKEKVSVELRRSNNQNSLPFVAYDPKGRVILFDKTYADWFTNNGVGLGDTIEVEIQFIGKSFYIAIPLAFVSKGVG